MSSSDFQPLFSIIIPARNEGQDIGYTLERCLALRYPRKEIVVVDDSSDNTPEIVSRYADRGVRLLHRTHNENGCCGARNLGMQQARGDIIVLLNADATPPPDFLDRILVHYRAGADYLLVRSMVANRDGLWGRFIAAEEDQFFASGLPMEWTEGFSCRRSAAEAAGFIPGDFPVRFCRDWRLGAALGQHDFSRHVDLSIAMPHVVPDNLAGFWANRLWRGTFTAPNAHYFENRTLQVITLREVLRSGRTLLRIGLVLPLLWRAKQLAAYSPRGQSDIPALALAGAIQDIAGLIGSWRGWRSLRKAVI